MATPTRPLILFDGVCNFCNASAKWIIKRDSRATFAFASLQSRAARDALTAAGARAPLPDSVVLIDASGVHTRSDAALRIAVGLGFPWSLASCLKLVPRSLRDWVYAWFARHRYSWFGRSESCMMPTPEIRARFIDAEAATDSEDPTQQGVSVPPAGG
ncbi:MAG: thiol-disulfide oxidoreductase DCC family protein [bacterium]|nr:thiol-disulfide oxidoreductase DCC family protein [bacterium]